MGAGLGGLLVAWRARAAGERVLVHEAAPTTGGRTRTETRAGWRVERGAWFLPGSLPPAGLSPEAAQRLGMAPLVGTVASVGPRGLVPLWTRARATAATVHDALTPRRRATTSAREPESLAAFARRRFGAGIAHDVVRTVAEAVWPVGAERVGVGDALPSWLAREARRRRVGVGLFDALTADAPLGWQVAGGMSAVLERLCTDLGTCVRTGQRVVQVLPGAGPADARLVFADGTRSDAGSVTLAVPAAEQARLLRAAAPPLADRLPGAGDPGVVRVTVGWTPGASGPVPPPHVGVVRGRARLRVRSVLFPTAYDTAAAPPGSALAVAWLGGEHDPQAMTESEPRLVRRALADLGLVLGGRVRPDVVDVQRVACDAGATWPGRRALLLDDVRTLAGVGVDLVLRPTWTT